MRRNTPLLLALAFYFLLFGFEIDADLLRAWNGSSLGSWFFQPVLGMAFIERPLIAVRLVLIYLLWCELLREREKDFFPNWALVALILSLSFLSVGLAGCFGFVLLGLALRRKLLVPRAALVVLLLFCAPLAERLQGRPPAPSGALPTSELKSKTYAWIKAENYFYARHYAALWVEHAPEREREQAKQVFADLDQLLAETRQPTQEP